MAYTIKFNGGEIYFDSRKEYIEKVFVKVLKENYDSEINEKTTAKLLSDFDDFFEQVEDEYEYEIKDKLAELSAERDYEED